MKINKFVVTHHPSLLNCERRSLTWSSRRYIEGASLFDEGVETGVYTQRKTASERTNKNSNYPRVKPTERECGMKKKTEVFNFTSNIHMLLKS